MSASRTKYITQEFPISTATWNNNVYTANTSSAHSLFANVEITLLGSTQIHTASATVLANNQFSVPMLREKVDHYRAYTVRGYLPGTTGPQEPQSMQRGMNTDAIVHSYVTGTGGAAYTLEVSLDNSHFINAASFVHTTTSGDTGFVTISPGWTHFRANVISVGANTLLTIMSGN
jgi:hypothetical protein